MKNKIFVAVAAVIILGLLAAAGVFIYGRIEERYRESEVKMELSTYYMVPEGEAMLIFDEKVSEKYALFKDGEPFIDLPTVKEYYTSVFTWNPVENRMYYTTPSTEYVITPDSKEILVNENAETLEFPVVILSEEIPYISMSFLKKCSNITYRVYEKPARVLITYSTDEYLCAKVKEESAIRVSQDIKADYLEKIPAGSTVRIIEGGGIQKMGFIKVMSEDGVRGYFLQDKLDWDNRFNQTPTFEPYEPETVAPRLEDKKIYLAWQLVYNKDCTGEMLTNLLENPEINVVSPTWYFMNGTDGSIKSYATREYVEAAHARGVKVWALLKNDAEGEFNGAADSHMVFSSYDARKQLIKNVIRESVNSGVDGINVDIESLNVDTGIYYVQFLRELSIACREKGLTLSVDNIIPEEYNAFYNIPEQVKIVDYIVLMAYDEHYLGSEAGSVASLPWVTASVEKTLKKCPKEQLILALPFYTRLWTEVRRDGKVQTTSGLMTISESQAYVAEKSLQGDWEKATGQYYYGYEAEFGEVMYRMWMEDKKSLMLKTLVAREQELAGIAAWKMGDETEGLWSILKASLEGEIPVLDETSNEPEETEDGDHEEEDRGP